MMPAPILATKLHVPSPRPLAVRRPRLIARLDEGLAGGRGRALSLISAPAGFGKTTLLGEWIELRRLRDPGLGIAWLSLDEGDGDPSRFLLYLAAALQGIEPGCGADAMAALQSPRPPSFESIRAELVNEIEGMSRDLLLVLDDYHEIVSPRIDEELAFLLEYRPPRLQLAIATREDPNLPFARLRARGELVELRAADLRFSSEEAADFLGRVMGLRLEAEELAALEGRTEGWIAGLQLAALSMRGREDAGGFIRSFTGGHRFVLDYLAEEVLRREPEGIQAFLLRTSVLDRLCGPLCDALMRGGPCSLPGLGATAQETLEYLERANLFILPLDDERRWYRYHRLFAELLRQRLEQGGGAIAAGLHARASEWYEDEGDYIEAFRHAAAAGDLDRAERLATSRGTPVHFRGAVIPILDWVSSLPAATLDARPSLRVLFSTLSLVAGRTTGVEEALDAAASALSRAEGSEKNRDLLGRIEAARATLAVTRYRPDEILDHARRAFEYLLPEDLPFRMTATWAIAVAHFLKGDRAAIGRAFEDLESMSRLAQDLFFTQLALCGLGEVQLQDNRLYQAAESFRRALETFGEQPQPNANEAHLGLARISYERNELDAAEEEGELALHLARQYDDAIDRSLVCELFLARVKLTRGFDAAADAKLRDLAATARARGFLHRLPEIAAMQALVLLRRGDVEAASRLAEAQGLRLLRARVSLARNEPASALAILERLGGEMEARGWKDEALKALVLRALALRAGGREEEALRLLGPALDQAEAGGFVRLFLDEGEPMAALLSAATARGKGGAYADKLLAAFAAESRPGSAAASASSLAQRLVDPLSQRELEVLALVAEGLSNREIGERLFLALDTIKGHNRRIFDKLDVKRRTEAIVRARGLGLL
jgi:LuxR family transcriptional regulator, maltose regulon positive regulatory protein